MSASATATGPSLGAGTYLTFHLGDEEYGIDILRVREIIGMLPITRVPGAPSEMIGVINLRGKVIPVVSLRARFHLQASEAHPHNVIVVVEGPYSLLGFAVDRVREVASFVDADLEAPPTYGLDVDASYVRSIAKSQNRVRILLAIDRLLSPEAAALVAGLPG